MSTSLATLNTAHAVSTDEMIEYCCQFGKARISMLESGWVAYIELRSPIKGMSGEIKSDFGMPSHRAALAQLVERCVVAFGKEPKGGES